MKHYDRRKNNEKNLAETFDLKALSEGAYRLNVYEDNLYVDIVNTISNIVFNNDIESIRFNLNMLYDDYLSDYIKYYLTIILPSVRTVFTNFNINLVLMFKII